MLASSHRSAAPARDRRRRLGPIALLMLALAPAAGMAQPAPAQPILGERLNAAAVAGPTALLDTLSRELARNPRLAATPGSAATLARAAATPVQGFVGARGPVYREIAQRIIAAAPAGQRGAVQQAVSEALRPYTEMPVRIALPQRSPLVVGTTRPAAPQVGSLGIKLGSFTVYPDVQASTYYDDNIYATSHGHVSDWIGTISPRIAIQSNWDRHSLYAEAGADLTGYWSHPHENSADWHVLSEGQIDVSDKTQILLGAIALKSHEDRASPDAVEGIDPTPYNEEDGYLGVVHRFGDFTLRLGGAIEHLTFGNVLGTHGEINNEDRDRTRYTFGGLLRYEANPKLRPFVEVMGDLRRYVTVPDDFGFNRNSDGFLAGVGTLYTLTDKLSGEVFLGVLHRNYTDPSFKSLTTPAADATLRWQATGRTAVVLFTERTIEETTLFGSPGYIYTLVGGRIEQRLTDRLTGILRAAYAHSDFAQAGRNDNDVDTSVGVRYRLTSRVTLGVDYRYTQRVSGSTLTDFSRNQVFFRIGTEF
ncbi:MAG TPA: outer membrane beta-barrel protein [Acetobacteraceae bacterium]|nr:outer membrane beta-barrel protein [Acetobacteraceae bacterium]